MPGTVQAGGSAKAKPAANKDAKEEATNAADMKFILECLKNMDTDKLVNLSGVAESLNYTNVASVGNKFRAMKKRYGFANLDSKTTAATKDKTGPVSPRTPAKRPRRAAKTAKYVSDEEETTEAATEVDEENDETPVKSKAPPKKRARKGAKDASESAASAKEEAYITSELDEAA